jgi:hypothetical protein
MAQSDNVAFAELLERVLRLEEQVKELTEIVRGKDMHEAIYGTDQPNHTEERAIRRGPGRPPGS